MARVYQRGLNAETEHSLQQSISLSILCLYNQVIAAFSFNRCVCFFNWPINWDMNVDDQPPLARGAGSSSVIIGLKTSKSCIFMNNLRPCLTDTLKECCFESVCVCLCASPLSPTLSFNDLTQWARTELGHSFSRASGVRDDAIATAE
ncbi:hypothetical protein GOODEAATRI_021537 [Goodea atripinnis]|uniref:Uncharacterized protein n=1 Tax=Goodea atripinnis TaxID=208336 RepID=A0ABV0MJP4_9TELE